MHSIRPVFLWLEDVVVPVYFDLSLIEVCLASA